MNSELHLESSVPPPPAACRRTGQAPEHALSAMNEQPGAMLCNFNSIPIPRNLAQQSGSPSTVSTQQNGSFVTSSAGDRNTFTPPSSNVVLPLTHPLHFPLHHYHNSFGPLPRNEVVPFGVQEHGIHIGFPDTFPPIWDSAFSRFIEADL